MIENLKLQEKNKIKKLEKNAETRMAVYIYIYIVYCHLENKKVSSKVAGHKFVKFSNKIRDRTILKLGIRLFEKDYFSLNLVMISIDLSLFGYT